jgi:hypothetical protein
VASVAVTVQCPGCSRSRQVWPRADGTLPGTVRCASSLGGCGKRNMRVPRPVAAARDAGVIAAAASGEWDPPSEPRGPRDAGGTCSYCHGPVEVNPRGTTMWCPACGLFVTPPGVLAPYERGGTIVRQARSQRETDLDALDLAGRQGVMLGELRALAADDRLGDASLMKVEWFAAQVKAAASGGRLDDLADLFTQARIKPRGWFKRHVSVSAGYAEGENSGYEDDGDYVDDEPAVVLALPAAAAQPVTWATAMSACGWRMDRTADGCQVVEHSTACGAGTAHGIATATWTGGQVCTRHYAALELAADGANRERGTA